MNFINDNISEVDMLGYDPYIDAFEYLIEKQNTLMNLPIVFGIHGKWGVGKSTFMDLIDKRLKQKNKYYTIKINPWEFKEKTDFVSVFLVELFKAVQEDLTDVEKGKEDSVISFLKAIMKPLKITASTPKLPYMGEAKVEYDFGKLNFEFQKTLVDNYIKENYELKSTINDILEYDLFDTNKIIIFIDDLDRCSENVVLDILESIKLVLNSKNCIFFLGCDKEYLECALSIKYKELIEFLKTNEESEQTTFKKFADEYLEKIIQIPFYIPPLTEETISKYIYKLLNNDTEVVTKDELEEVNYLERYKTLINSDLVTKLFFKVNLNPRRIKRILNITFLNYLFMVYKNTKKSIDDSNLNLLLFLGMLRDEHPLYFKKKLISGMLCKRTFDNMFKVYKNKNIDELSEEDKVVEGLFQVFFHTLKIANKSDLNKLMNEIEYLLTISRITTSENLNESIWGEIGEIRSKTGTNKKLLVFLNRITNQETIRDFAIWLFGDLYDDENFYLGIEKNVHFYKNSEGDHYNNFIMKIEYDESENELLLKFEVGKYRCIIDTEKILSDLKQYNKTLKQIVIKESESLENIVLIKNEIKKLIEGV